MPPGNIHETPPSQGVPDARCKQRRSEEILREAGGRTTRRARRVVIRFAKRSVIDGAIIPVWSLQRANPIAIRRQHNSVVSCLPKVTHFFNSFRNYVRHMSFVVL